MRLLHMEAPAASCPRMRSRLFNPPDPKQGEGSGLLKETPGVRPVRVDGSSG